MNYLGSEKINKDKQKIDKEKLLFWASEKGYIEVVKLLLEAGADVHADNDWALCCAIIKGYREIINLLVEHGADVHLCSNMLNNDDHALRHASACNSMEVIREILKIEV